MRVVRVYLGWGRVPGGSESQTRSPKSQAPFEGTGS